MPGLLSTLQLTSSALAAQSAAINVTSNNIANSNNPNYSREVPVISDLGSVETDEGSESTGLTVAVQQQRDALLDQMVRQQAALTDGYTAQQTVLQDAQASLGENISNDSADSSSSTATTTESGLSSAIDSFFNSFETLAADPTNSGDIQSLVQQAGVLTDRFQQINQNLDAVQANATTQVNSDVTSANSLLTQISKLNTQIAGLEVGNPGSAVTLRDQREADLEQLSGLVPVTVTEDAKGEDTVTTTDTSGNPISLVTEGAVNNSLSYSGGVLLAGTTAVGVNSGSIQGTINASVGPVQQLQTSLDTLANQIVTSVNAAYNPSSTANGNFFLASGTTAGTIALDPNLTASTLTAGNGSAGDNSIALAVANVANQQFSTAGGDAIDGTIDGYYAGAVTNLGQSLDTANTNVTEQTNVQTYVTNQREAESGVSVDQEMSNLMSYERSYQASSEIMQVVSDMLSSLINDVAASG